ncbi:MAG: methionyl-tRNA formyltransferase [Syntrophobacteraceae bacterium]
MRIVLIGQAAFGAKALEALMEKGENIVAVYTPPDRPGGKPDPTKEAALARNLPVYQPAGYRKEETFSQYMELKPDLTVLAFVTDIIPARYFEAASSGAICYHPSILPRHRGSSAINWAVIMGDTRTGLTIFWPDGGIDTGPILLQKEIPIQPNDTTGSLYFNQLFPMGIEAIVESVDLIKAGKAPKIPQDEAGATYESPCTDAVARIDWGKSGQEVHDLVRGCDPQPGAFALWNGEKTRFFGVRLQLETGGPAAGTLTAIDEAGIHVAVSGGTLIVSKVRGAGGKVSGADWAAEKGAKVGDHFDILSPPTNLRTG